MLFIPSAVESYELATSYLSVEEAEKIMVSQVDTGAWGALPMAAKQMLLSQASLAVDGLYSYKGGRTSEGQYLKFPRGGSFTIPASLKFAVAMLCVSYSKDEAFKGITSESIGKMSWTYANAEQGISSEVMSFLKPLRMKSVRIQTR